MFKSPLWDSIRLSPRQKQDETLELLKKIPVFEGISDRNLKIIYSLCHLRNYKEGELVFQSGEPGVGMYIILEGKVEIYLKDQERHLEYAVLYEGDFFGEIALLDDLPRTASARATTYSALLGFYRPDLLNLLNRNPSLAGEVLMNIAKLIGRRLVNTNQELEKLQIEAEQKRNKRSILSTARPQTKSSEHH